MNKEEFIDVMLDNETAIWGVTMFICTLLTICVLLSEPGSSFYQKCIDSGGIHYISHERRSNFDACVYPINQHEND